MGVIVTIASQKGGVGKTTTAVNLAYSVALAGKRVLLLDFDPQGNGSSGVGYVPNSKRSQQAGCLARGLARKSLDRLVWETPFENLSLMPRTEDLSQLSVIQQVVENPGHFRKAMSRLGGQFDYLLIDCPPSLGGLPTIALQCSDRVVIPVQCEYYAMEGLSQILPVIQKLQEGLNPKLTIGGLLLTMFSEELELSHEVVREIRSYFGENMPGSVFETVIPRDVTLAEAASHGKPAFQFEPSSKGAWSYIELAREVIRNEWS